MEYAEGPQGDCLDFFNVHSRVYPANQTSGSGLQSWSQCLTNRALARLVIRCLMQQNLAMMRMAVPPCSAP